jgi:hypothetical protein
VIDVIRRDSSVLLSRSTVTDLGLEVLRSRNVNHGRLCKSDVEKIRTEFFFPGEWCHDKLVTMGRPDELLNLDEGVTRRQSTSGGGGGQGMDQGGSGLEGLEEVQGVDELTSERRSR